MRDAYMLQVLFPIIPMHCDLERMKEGGNHWQWHPERPYYIGVLPRRGAKSTDIKVKLSSPLGRTVLI